MSRNRHDPPPLAPDDPRLSEWLDGRLTAPEAAAIERLVAASPELTKLVADLRGMRGRLGAVPVTPPPAGFVRDVLAAIDAAGDEAADDAKVEEEWRRIERQRLEGEIAEAVDDAAKPAAEPMRQRWPWLALAGALAAGVLVAVAINRPGGLGDREVAVVETRPEVRRAAELAGKDKAKVADTWLEDTAAVPAAAPPVPAAAAPAPGGIGSPPAAAADAAEEPQVRTVSYRIRSAADRQRLDDLLAASGLGAGKAPVKAAERLRRTAAAGGEAEAGSGDGSGATETDGGPVPERIVLSGPAGAMASLAAALEAAQTEDFEQQGKGQEPDAAARVAPTPLRVPQERDLQAAREPEVRLVIEVVEEVAAAEDQP